MRHAIRTISTTTLLLAAVACASWHSFHSETTIAGGQSFLLGGDQASSFVATVRNTGTVPVAILVEAAGVRHPVTVLLPNATVDATIEPKQIAVFSNASSVAAVIRVAIRGRADNLGMRYDATGRAAH